MIINHHFFHLHFHGLSFFATSHSSNTSEICTKNLSISSLLLPPPPKCQSPLNYYPSLELTSEASLQHTSWRCLSQNSCKESWDFILSMKFCILLEQWQVLIVQYRQVKDTSRKNLYFVKLNSVIHWRRKIQQSQYKWILL